MTVYVKILREFIIKKKETSKLPRCYNEYTNSVVFLYTNNNSLEDIIGKTTYNSKKCLKISMQKSI